jgi:hypothetical protein
MSRTLDRVNRVLLLLVGLVLLAAGAAAASTALGAFGESVTDRAVLDGETDRYIRDHSWIWWALAGLCFLLAILALRWLVAQLTSHRVRRVVLQHDRSEGHTVVRSSALSSAVEDDVEAFHGVRRARLELFGEQTAPAARLVVDVEDRADLSELRERIAHEAVPSLRRCLDSPSLPVHALLRLRGGAANRVV